MLKYKLKASLIHLGLSILLVGMVIGSILFFFFPSLFIGVTDFKEVATLIISIDLILGPLLTFVVFQPKKKSLKFDLSVIGAIQLTALCYGAFALYQIHPVYITFNIDRFTVISARDAEPEKATNKLFNISKLQSGKLAFAKMPTSLDQRNALLLDAASGREDLDKREEYYEPVENNLADILIKSLDPKIIFTSEKTKGNYFYKKYQYKLEEFAYLPLNSENKDAIIVIDKITAKPIATLDIDPWELSQK